MLKANKKAGQTSIGEKLAYGGYFFGQNIFYALVTTLLTPFMTDIGITVYAIAVLSLIVKVWDAINDPIFGIIVDKINLKQGKFLPWLRVAAFATPVATFLMFAIPSSLPLWVKLVWSGLAYILWDVAYTISDAPLQGLVTTITDNQNERSRYIAIGRFAGMTGVMVAMMVVGSARTVLGGWLMTVLIISAVGMIFMIPLCIITKERYVPPVPEKSYGFKDMFDYLKNNKYLIIMYAGKFLFYAFNIGTTLIVYLCRYNLGNEGMMIPLTILTMAPIIIVSAFMPALARKFDRFHLLMLTLVATVLLGIASYFAGYENMMLFMIFSFLRGLFSSFFMCILFLFTPDCAEYGTYKTGTIMLGITFSMQTFVSKLISAVTTTVAAIALGIIGFLEGEGAVQLAGFNDKLWFIFIILPTIGALISIPVFMMYKLRDRHVKIIMECNKGEISREEAQRLLGNEI